MKVEINGKMLNANEGETILELAKRNDINIPSLCHKKGFDGLGRCRMCLVEIKEGHRTKLVSSCVYPVKDELKVQTHTDEIIKIRKDIVMLMYLKSPKNKYVQKLAEEYEIMIPEKYVQKISDDCILCGLCVEACRELGTSAISMVNRGTGKKVSTPYDDESKDCIGCGSCAEVCPTNAITMTENENTRTIWNRTFELVSCEICGKNYTTLETLKYSENLLGQKIECICDECKKKITAATFKESFKNIY
ncbi:MAG: (2Fe-2S)-binding protein [Tissierellales bacterium]|nr:(2Fe-2S)-binding protein [Tissierellales bacterium]MBN2826768.1 (2Fe-2S)-binding protein [Tissierellales bacterium]